MRSEIFRLQHIIQPGPSRPRLSVDDCAITAMTTALWGESGAGKTTLLNLLVRFERPARGRVIRGPWSQDDTGSRLAIYWSPAQGGLWHALSVEEHLRAVAPELSAQGRMTWLDRFDLASRAQSRAENLSQGERSRLSIARALAANPRVLVLDEPLAHVGTAHQVAGWEAIRQWQREREGVLIYATHNHAAAAMADDVLRLSHGEIVEQGPAEQVFGSSGVTADYGPVRSTREAH